MLRYLTFNRGGRRKMPIAAIRTPEERFAYLPNFPYSPNYIESLPGYHGLRMHYVDEGPIDAENTFLCLHGEPTWSYLYRKMIPVFVNTGGRVIAPDFFGFGRSDKPINDSDITFSFHRDSLLRLIEQLDLQNITLVCQDWGGILGLTLPGSMKNRFKRLIIMNTALPIGKSLGEGFEMWKSYAAQFNDVSVSGLLAANCPGVLDMMDIAAYAAPFPDATYKAGVRRFPELVAVNPEMEGVNYAEDAKRFLSTEWDGQSFMAVGSLDPFFGQSIMDDLRSTIKNCPEPVVLSDVGHFVQEWGEDVAKKALKYFEST